MPDVGKGYVQIIPSAQGLKGKVQNMLGSECEKAGKSGGNKFTKALGSALKAGSAAVIAGTTAVATAMASITKSAVENFADYEQLVGGAQLLFADESGQVGEAYDYITEKAANAYKNVQMSTNDYLEQVNGLSTGLKTALGGDVQAAAELADKVVTAEADVVSATGTSQEAVQNAFNGIMKSNYTMLDNLQLGITPTKEGMQEVIDKVNEWNAANGEATSYEIDNLADCQAALVDYVEMQGMAGYAAKEGANTIQGSLASTKAAWENLLTGLADKDADIGQLVDNLVETLVGDGSGGGLVNQLLPVIEQALDGILDAAPQLLDQILPVVQDLLTKVIEFLVQCLPQLITVAVGMIDTIVEGLTEAIPILVDYLPTIIEAIVVGLLKLGGALLEAGVQLIASLVEGFGQMLEPVKNKASEIINGAKEAINNKVADVKQAGIDIVTGLWNGINSKLSWIKNKISSFCSSALDSIKDFFGIASPSKVMRDEVGKWIPEGISVGINANADSVYDAMNDITTGATSTFDYTGAVRTSANGINTSVNNGAASGGVLNAISAIRQDISNLKESMNMGIYLDGNTLVGGIANRMDNTLGRKQALALRGV